MNILQKLSRWALEKAVGFPPWSAAGPWPSSVISAFAGGQASLQLSTVYGCVRVRGQTMGSLPFNVYRENAQGERVLVKNHWLYPILHDFPNATQSSFEWRELMERSFCLYGNAYSLIQRIGKQVVGLQFLNPDAIIPRYDPIKGEVVYTYSWQGAFNVYSTRDILHVKNHSNHGYWGDSPIRSYAVNHAIEAQDYGRYFLQNLGRPAGYLKFKGKRPANEEANNKLRADWQALHGGVENAGKTAVLWEEGEYMPLSVAPEEAQYIETRGFSIEEIAGGIFGVPLNLIGRSVNTATYASAEQFSIDYVRFTVSPQADRYAAAIKRALLRDEPDIVCAMDVDSLTRGDSQALATLSSTLVQNGIATRNEMRRRFSLPRMDGADELTAQVNLSPLDQLNTARNVTQPGGGPPQQQPPQPPKSSYGLRRSESKLVN